MPGFQALGGVDSLYSIVQMPRGVPVATVAIGNAKNAGLLAIRMIVPQLRHRGLKAFLAHFLALHHAHAVQYALISAYAHRVLTGAYNPMFCSVHPL